MRYVNEWHKTLKNFYKKQKCKMKKQCTKKLEQQKKIEFKTKNKGWKI
jgi:hypothetical protein